MLETVANFLPTPLGTSISEPCSEHLQLRCWNVPASSPDHWGPSGTPPMTVFHCRGLRLAWECRKSPVDAHMRFRKSICLMSVHLPRGLTFKGNERWREYTETPSNLIPTWEKSWQQEQSRRARPLSYSSFPRQFPGLPQWTSPAL